MADFNFTSQLGGGGSVGGRARFGVLFVHASAAGVHVSARNALGQYTADQGKAAAVNARLAAELADHMVTNLQASLVRPGVSTGRLATALAAPGNRSADKDGFGAGNPAFLDRSAAKYWRAIESGTSFFVGRQITGVWGGTLSGEVTPGGKYGPYPRAVEPFTGFGGGSGERLRPMGRRQAYRTLRAAGFKSKDIRTRGIIEKPIDAHFYMENAWREFDVRGRAEQLVRELYPMASKTPPVKRR